MNGTPLSTDFRLLNTDSALIDRLIISPSFVLLPSTSFVP